MKDILDTLLNSPLSDLANNPRLIWSVDLGKDIFLTSGPGEVIYLNYKITSLREVGTTSSISLLALDYIVNNGRVIINSAGYVSYQTCFSEKLLTQHDKLNLFLEEVKGDIIEIKECLESNDLSGKSKSPGKNTYSPNQVDLEGIHKQVKDIFDEGNSKPDIGSEEEGI